MSRRVDRPALLLGLWGLAVFAFLLLPILTIVVHSFNAGRVLVIWEGFSLQPFERALSDPTLRASVATSLQAALGSALLATALGTLAGVAVARRPGRWAPVLLGLVALVLVTPEIVNAISLLIWFVRIGGPFGPENEVVSYGLARLWAGHAIFSTAVVTLIVRARVAGMDQTLEEAAADLYATPLRRFRQITLPLVAPAVIAAFLLTFSLSLDNTIISSFVSVAGTSPWPVYVFSSVRSTLRPEVAAMSTLILLLTVAALVLVAVVLRRGADSDVAGTLAGKP